MFSVAASELQKNFGEWLEKALVEPIAINRYGRTSGYLISAALFEKIAAHCPGLLIEHGGHRMTDSNALFKRDIFPEP